MEQKQVKNQIILNYTESKYIKFILKKELNTLEQEQPTNDTQKEVNDGKKEIIKNIINYFN